jgi:hypothetical protein
LVTDTERQVEYLRRRQEIRTVHWSNVVANIGLAVLAAGVLAPLFNLTYNQRDTIQSYGSGAPLIMSLWIFCAAMLYLVSANILKGLP